MNQIEAAIMEEVVDKKFSTFLYSILKTHKGEILNVVGELPVEVHYGDQTRVHCL